MLKSSEHNTNYGSPNFKDCSDIRSNDPPILEKEKGALLKRWFTKVLIEFTKPNISVKTKFLLSSFK